MFRDDHEAALERIAALEEELKREHAETRSAQRELDETRRALERAEAPSKALVAATPTSVSTGVSHAEMIARVEAAERRDMRFGVSVIAAIAAIGLIFAVFHPTGVAAMLTLSLLMVPVVAATTIGAATCPACAKPIGGDRGGTQLMLLKNLKQCPHCQAKFD